MTVIYEVAVINRAAGLTDNNRKRLERRVTIGLLKEGCSAILPLVEDPERVLRTSTVMEIRGNDSDDEIIFTTKNTTYCLRKVGD